MHLARAVEAVAAGFAPGTLGEYLAIDHLLAEEHHQPLGRTDEFFLACSPAHALGDRQIVQRGLDDAWQQLGGRLALDGTAELELRPAAIDLGKVDATLAGKAQGGLGRLTVGVEGGLHRRAVEVDAAIRLLSRQLLDQHRQAARRGVGLGFHEVQAGVLQALLDTGAESFGQLGERLRWQFFGTQFDEEIQCTHSAASSLASTSSRSSGVAMGKPSLARASR